MNGDIFKKIAFKLILIVSVAEAAEAVDVVEVNVLAEDSSLDCYR